MNVKTFEKTCVCLWHHWHLYTELRIAERAALPLYTLYICVWDKNLLIVAPATLCPEQTDFESLSVFSPPNAFCRRVTALVVGIGDLWFFHCRGVVIMMWRQPKKVVIMGTHAAMLPCHHATMPPCHAMPCHAAMLPLPFVSPKSLLPGARPSALEWLQTASHRPC